MSSELGFELDGWQEQVLDAALGVRADGRWASRLVGVSAPRQQGKSQLIVARALAGVLLFGEKTIICSAHQTDTAREVFQRLLDAIEVNPGLEKRVTQVMRALNREFIRFDNGATIRIKARSVSGSRGFSADCLLLDEAQILGAAAWASILPTMSARDNPQAWLLGTPPTPEDDGEVFGRLRDTGVRGKDTRSTWVEWSADPADDFDDPEVWAKANPAFGIRISREAIASERAAMSDEQFAMERLGMWSSALKQSLIPAASWRAAADPESAPAGLVTLGVECGPDLAWAAVAVAGQRDDKLWHVSLEDDQYTKGRGTAWLAPYVAEMVRLNPQIRGVVVDVAGPIAALLEQRHGRWFFKDTQVQVSPVKVAELGAGCSRLLDGVVTGWLRHLDQPNLSAAALSASKRDLGDTGMWVWKRRAEESDITPVQAATLALLGAQSDAVRRPGGRVGNDKGRRGTVYG